MITKKELYNEIAIALNKLLYDDKKISYLSYKKVNDELIKNINKYEFNRY